MRTAGQVCVRSGPARVVADEPGRAGAAFALGQAERAAVRPSERSNTYLTSLEAETLLFIFTGPLVHRGAGPQADVSVQQRHICTDMAI